MVRAQVVNAGAREIPVTRTILLAQRKNMHITPARQPTDQREQRRYHSILARAVDASGHYQGNAVRLPGCHVTRRRWR